VDEKRTVLLIATIIADLIVLAGWGVAAAFAVRLLNAKARAATVPEAPDPSRPLLYAAAVVLWPFALAFGMMKMSKPETVRTGRVLLLIGLGHFTFATLVAVAIVTAVAVDPPRFLLDLLP
jgi:hypothetical protein